MVERYIAPIKRRVDLFGFIDIISFSGFKAPLQPNDLGVLGVQACRSHHVNDRMRKAQACDKYADWISSVYRRFQVWGWRKTGARGKRKVWHARILEWSKGKKHREEREYFKGMIL